MYHIKNDRRARRSAQQLFEALARLLEDKPFADISVTELVETAQVGRATFYRNFDTMEDILRLRCDQIFAGLLDEVKANRGQRDGALLTTMLHYFENHIDIIALLLKAQRIDILQDAFRRGATRFQPPLAALLGPYAEFAPYGVAMRIGVLTGILVTWVTHRQQHTPEALAAALPQMMDRMITLEQLL